MFELAKYPEIVQTQFLDPILPWEVVFESAIDAGITDRNMAADLIFFKNHPERMHGGSGTALNRSERGFRDLVKEWEGWRDSVVEPRLADRVSWHGRRFTPLGLDDERIIQLEKRSVLMHAVGIPPGTGVRSEPCPQRNRKLSPTCSPSGRHYCGTRSLRKCSRSSVSCRWIPMGWNPNAHGFRWPAAKS